MKQFIMCVISILMITTMACTQTIDKPLKETANRCVAMTAKGTQCSRNATKGKDKCTQHLKSSTTAKTYYIGANGGVYYYNSKGNKVYVKTK